MEALLRNTLEWVKVNPKEQFNNYDLILNGNNVTPEKVLAVRGNLFTKKYGYCSCCGKVMTEKEFKRHTTTKVSMKECVNCGYCRTKNKKMISQNGEFIVKCNVYCSYSYSNQFNITKDSICPRISCSGGTFTTNPIVKVKLPSEVITIKQFVNNPKWKLEYKSDRFIMFKHIRYNISASFDTNGYLIYFQYNGRKCYFNGTTLKDFHGRTAIDSERLVNIVRGFYS